MVSCSGVASPWEHTSELASAEAVSLATIEYEITNASVMSSRHLLLRSAEHQEERLHRSAPEHAGLRFHAGATRTVSNHDEGQLVSDQLVQQGTLPVPHQRLLPNQTRWVLLRLQRATTSRRVAHRVCARDRRDHQEEERGDPVSAGCGGVRRSPQLHLQIRRQVQQVGENASTRPRRWCFSLTVLKKLLFLLLQIFYLP